MFFHRFYWIYGVAILGDRTCWKGWEVVLLSPILWWWDIFQTSQFNAQVTLLFFFSFTLLNCSSFDANFCPQWRSRWICSKQISARSVSCWQELLRENMFINQRICFTQVWYERRGPLLDTIMHFNLWTLISHIIDFQLRI